MAVYNKLKVSSFGRVEMTILIGFKSQEDLILMADRMSSRINHDGVLAGENSRVDKVELLHPKAMFSTAGISQLGTAVKSVLTNTLNFNEDLTKDQILNAVKETLVYCHELFVKTNPHVTYTDLAAILGGYEDNMEAFYLYGFSSVNNFEPVECRPETGFFVMSPSNDITRSIESYIHDNIGTRHAVTVLAEAIRGVDAPDVSKDTIALNFSRSLTFPQYRTIRLDEEGNLQ
jgi:hypothetical protein